MKGFVYVLLAASLYCSCGRHFITPPCIDPTVLELKLEKTINTDKKDLPYYLEF